MNGKELIKLLGANPETDWECFTHEWTKLQGLLKNYKVCSNCGQWEELNEEFDYE